MDARGNDELDRQLVLEAVGMLGDEASGTLTEIAGKVTRRALLLKRLCSERSVVMRTLRAVPIPCTVKAVSLEASSQRYVVTFVSDSTGEEERIRTDRVDSANGPLVERMWPRLAGHRAVIYKLNEEGREESRAGNGYRCAPFVQDLGAVR